MGGFLTPQTFNPPVGPIALGTSGQVLTMLGGAPAFAAATPPGQAGTYLAYASASGSLNDVAPTGFGGGVGILDVTLAGGPATWTGLTAGSDRQVLIIANADAANDLTLAALNAGSLAANRFRNSGDLDLPPRTAVLLVYSTTAGQWIVT